MKEKRMKNMFSLKGKGLVGILYNLVKIVLMGLCVYFFFLWLLIIISFTLLAIQECDFDFNSNHFMCESIVRDPSLGDYKAGSYIEVDYVLYMDDSLNGANTGSDLQGTVNDNLDRAKFIGEQVGRKGLSIERDIWDFKLLEERHFSNSTKDKLREIQEESNYKSEEIYSMYGNNTTEVQLAVQKLAGETWDKVLSALDNNVGTDSEKIGDIKKNMDHYKDLYNNQVEAYKDYKESKEALDNRGSGNSTSTG